MLNWPVANNFTLVDDPEETTTLTASGNETDSLTATTLFIGKHTALQYCA